jgi:hypothetical protein
MGKNTGSEDAGIDRKSHMGYDQTAWSGLPLRGAIAGALTGHLFVAVSIKGDLLSASRNLASGPRNRCALMRPAYRAYRCGTAAPRRAWRGANAAGRHVGVGNAHLDPPRRARYRGQHHQTQSASKAASLASSSRRRMSRPKIDKRTRGLSSWPR